MKELDKALINSDVDRIVFLLNQKVDCECAVLMHLKEQLVPKHFSEEALRARGAILNLEDLNSAILKYTQLGSFEHPVDTYRMDFYIKRLYLSSQQALKAWQTGRLSNQVLENRWDLDSIHYLASKWIQGDLPKALQNYAQEAQNVYIEEQYQKWLSQSLALDVSKGLDELLLSNLRNHWHFGDESADPVCRQIRSIVIDEAVELCRSNTDEAFTKDVIAFMRGKVTEQLYNGSLNGELIKNVLEEEKSRILKDKAVPNHAPYYEQALLNLFTKWQAGELDVHAHDDVTVYIKKQFLSYPLSGQLKSDLLEKAIPSLLVLYRKGVLPADVMEQLALQFKSNIVGHYEKDASKDTPFRNELSQVIFSQLLADWKSQGLEVEVSALQYLQSNLLSDLQKSLQEFGLPTSRFTLYMMVTQLMDRVTQLEGELSALKASKESTPLAQVSDVKPKETETSLALAAQQLGVFKPEQTSNSALFKDAVVIPKQPGPGASK